MRSAVLVFSCMALGCDGSLCRKSKDGHKKKLLWIEEELLFQKTVCVCLFFKGSCLVTDDMGNH